MKQSGSVNWMVIVGLIGVVVITGLMFVGGDSATPAGSRFMIALGTGDVDTLAEVSYIPDKSKEEIRKDWESTTKLTKYVLFKYKFLGEDRVADDQATIRMDVMKPSTGYDEKFSLPMRKIDGEWKVEVRGLSRQLYPFLPR